MNLDEWRAGLKLDDEILVKGHYGYIGKVSKVTATQIVVTDKRGNSERRFMKASGQQVGAGSWGSPFELLPVTDSDRELVAARDRRTRLSHLVSYSGAISKLTDAEVTAMLAGYDSLHGVVAK